MADDYPSCIESQNLICKHVRSENDPFPFNLDFLPVGITIVSATADTTDPELSVDSVEIVETDIVIDQSPGCTGTELEAGRAAVVSLSGGTPSDEEVLVILNYVRSDGVSGSREGRFIIQGTPLP